MVFIILVNWKGGYDTIRCLESIFRSMYDDFKVIVVDNNSQDDSIELISAWADARLCGIPGVPLNEIERLSFPPIAKQIPYVCLPASVITHEIATSVKECGWDELIENNRLFIVANSKNAGFGAGNNVGLNLMQFAKECKYFWLLNNDTVIEQDTLARLVEYASNYPRTVIGAMLRYYDNPSQIQAAGGGCFSCKTGIVRTLVTRSDSEIDFINGASFFAPKEYSEEVGGFDENIFMYFEENDYCIRGKSKGFAFRCSDVVVYHKMGGSKFGSERAWQQQFTNKYYTLKKNYGFGCWLFFYFASLMINCTVLNRNSSKRRAALNAVKKFIRYESGSSC